MGRRSIPIEEIKEERRRHVTFAKRKTGLFKKAMELSILCKSNILLVVFDESQALHEYCSNEDPRPLLRSYFSQAHVRHERFCDDDYGVLYGNEKKSSKQIPLRSNPPLRIQNGREGSNYSYRNGPYPITQLGKATLAPPPISHPRGVNVGNIEQRTEPKNQPVIPKRPPFNNNPSFKTTTNRVTNPPVPPPPQRMVIPSHDTPPKKRTHERMKRTGFTPLPDHHDSYTYTGSTGFTPLPYQSSSEETKIRENQLDQLIQVKKEEELRKEGHIEFEGSPETTTTTSTTTRRRTTSALSTSTSSSIIPPPPPPRPSTSEIMMDVDEPRMMIPPTTTKPSSADGRKKSRPDLKIDVGGAIRYPIGKTNPSLQSVTGNSEYQFDTPLTQMFSDDIVKK